MERCIILYSCCMKISLCTSSLGHLAQTAEKNPPAADQAPWSQSARATQVPNIAMQNSAMQQKNCRLVDRQQSKGRSLCRAKTLPCKKSPSKIRTPAKKSASSNYGNFDTSWLTAQYLTALAIWTKEFFQMKCTRKLIKYGKTGKTPPYHSLICTIISKMTCFMSTEGV